MQTLSKSKFPSIKDVEDVMGSLLADKPDFYEQENQQLVRDAVDSLERIFVFDSDKESLIASVLQAQGWEETK